MTALTGWPDEAREAVAKAIYQRHHKGLRNVWHWDNAGLDIEHPGVRGVYLAQADAALAALAPFVATRVEAAAVAMRDAAIEIADACGAHDAALEIEGIHTSTDALAAALAQARREGMEEALTIAREAQSFVVYERIAAAIRAKAQEAGNE